MTREGGKSLKLRHYWTGEGAHAQKRRFKQGIKGMGARRWRVTVQGEIPQYYVEEHHEAIIPQDLFDFVQSEIKRREQNGKHSGVSIFANKIKCGC